MSAKHLFAFVLITAATGIPVYLFVFKQAPAADETPSPIPVVSAPEPTPAPIADAVIEVQKPKPANDKPDWEAVAREAAPAVAVVQGKLGHGTGFLLPESVLVTNAHVISLEFEEHLNIHFPSAAKKQHRGPFKARLLWIDRKQDLAFLRVECDVPFQLELHDEYRLRAGQEVLAIGSPGLTRTQKLENALSRGLMSTVAKLDGTRVFQLNINVNPGNSGGPVLDANGRVLGMVTAKLKNKEGIAFAIPAPDLDEAWQKQILAANNEASPELIATHRGNAIQERLGFLGEAYSRGLDANSQAMEEAVANGGSPADGLKAVTRDLAPQIKKINAILADGMEARIKAITNDANLVESDRLRIQKLWDACREMKAHFEKPSGTLDSYRTRSVQIKKQFSQLQIVPIKKESLPKSGI